MKNLLFLMTLFLITTIIYSCGWKEIEISDCSRPQEFILESNDESPFTLKLQISSETNGSFSIDGCQINEGSLNTELQLDAYDQIHHLLYKPITATKGKIKVKYRF